MSRVQGGFDKNSGVNQSAQKQQQEKITQVTIPLNCYLVNSIKSGKWEQSSASNHYDFNGPFENCIITAKYEFIQESGQNRIEGRLSDNTGYFNVITSKPKDTEQTPEYISDYLNLLSTNGNRLMYVRAMIKMKKNAPIQLVYFSIVHDANEITRHNLDIALRFQQRSNGFEDFMNAVQSSRAQPANAQNQKLGQFTVDKHLPPDQQILSYFRYMLQKNGNNNQIPKRDIIQNFSGLNTAQLNQYLSKLTANDEIIYVNQTDSYFLSD